MCVTDISAVDFDHERSEMSRLSAANVSIGGAEEEVVVDNAQLEKIAMDVAIETTEDSSLVFY